MPDDESRKAAKEKKDPKSDKSRWWTRRTEEKGRAEASAADGGGDAKDAAAAAAPPEPSPTPTEQADEDAAQQSESESQQGSEAGELEPTTSADKEKEKDPEGRKAAPSSWKNVKAALALNAPNKSEKGRSNTMDVTDGLLDGVAKTWKRTGGAAVATVSELAVAANREKVMNSALDAGGIAGKTALKLGNTVVKTTTGINVLADGSEPQVVYMEDGTIVTRTRAVKKYKPKKEIDPNADLTTAQTLGLGNMGVRVPTNASDEQVDKVKELISGVTNHLALEKGLQTGLVRYEVLTQHLGDPGGLEKWLMVKLESHRTGSQQTIGDLVSKAERGVATGAINLEGSGLVPTFSGQDSPQNRRSPTASPPTAGSGRGTRSATTIGPATASLSAATSAGGFGRRRTASDAAAAFNRTGEVVPMVDSKGPRPIRKPDTMVYRGDIENRVKGREKKVVWADETSTAAATVGTVSHRDSDSAAQPASSKVGTEQGSPMLRTLSNEADIFAKQLEDAKATNMYSILQQQEHDRRRQQMDHDIHTKIQQLKDRQHAHRQPRDRPARMVEQQEMLRREREQFRAAASDLHDFFKQPARSAGKPPADALVIEDTATEKLIKERAGRMIKSHGVSVAVAALGIPQQADSSATTSTANTAGEIERSQALVMIASVEDRARKLPEYKAASTARAKGETPRRREPLTDRAAQ